MEPAGGHPPSPREKSLEPNQDRTNPSIRDEKVQKTSVKVQSSSTNAIEQTATREASPTRPITGVPQARDPRVPSLLESVTHEPFERIQRAYSILVQAQEQFRKLEVSRSPERKRELQDKILMINLKLSDIHSYIKEIDGEKDGKGLNEAVRRVTKELTKERENYEKELSDFDTVKKASNPPNLNQDRIALRKQRDAAVKALMVLLKDTEHPFIHLKSLQADTHLVKILFFIDKVTVSQFMFCLDKSPKDGIEFLITFTKNKTDLKKSICEALVNNQRNDVTVKLIKAVIEHECNTKMINAFRGSEELTTMLLVHFQRKMITPLMLQNLEGKLNHAMQGVTQSCVVKEHPNMSDKERERLKRPEVLLQRQQLLINTSEKLLLAVVQWLEDCSNSKDPKISLPNELKECYRFFFQKSGKKDLLIGDLFLKIIIPFIINDLSKRSELDPMIGDNLRACSPMLQYFASQTPNISADAYKFAMDFVTKNSPIIDQIFEKITSM